MSAPLCFIDTETDGLHPGRNAWEIAMIRRGSDGKETAKHFFVEVDLSTADPMGLKIGGFYDRHPMGRTISRIHDNKTSGSSVALLSEEDAAKEVAVLTHGAHLVGAVPSFDAEVLSNLLRRNRLIPSWHYHLIDVEILAVGYLTGIARGAGEKDVTWAGTTQPPYKSDSLSRLCGVEPPDDTDRHTAMGDALWVERWYDRLMYTN